MTKPKLKHIEHVGDITLTEDYWDCNCLFNYIHDKCDTRCNICGAKRDHNHPDARVNEVLEMLKENMTDENNK